MSDEAELAEARRRLAKLDSGQTQAIPYEVIRHKLHEAVKSARQGDVRLSGARLD